LLDEIYLPGFAYNIRGHKERAKLCNFKGFKDTQDIPLPQLHMISTSDIDQAVSNAHAARRGPWGAITGEERGVIMNRLAHLTFQYAEEIAYFESLCSGVPISFAAISILSIVSVFRYKRAYRQ
jgi:acyl-CoA reductase-like NAD-dependent aldehyde dehydrogenase